MSTSSGNIQLRKSGGSRCILSGTDDHNVSVTSEEVDVGRKEGIADLHGMELRARLGAAEFKLFNNV